MCYLTVFNTPPVLISEKKYFLVCNSTLPPSNCYCIGNQGLVCGGIIGGIWVELHEVPPLLPP